MMKLKHLRHPLKTINTAASMFAARRHMLRLAAHGARHFKNDTRYDLQNVTEGFTSRIDDSRDDSDLLERICISYIKATEQQQSASAAYRATEWWAQIRQRSLSPVIRALQTRDIDTLRKMYRNFFRDPCSTGLIGVPYGMSSAYFGKRIRGVHRSVYLSLALHRLDYWMTQTSGSFALHDLAGPEIGNPFGLLLQGTLLRTDAEYAHYCAYRLGSLLDSQKSIVAEIGGGFGGMAYYLLRDHADLTYLNFDVPESIALCSYYLLKAFPQLTVLLYGEGELTKKTIDRADIVLMPLPELSSMPPESVDVTFSSHAMSDVSSDSMIEYVQNIEHVTRTSFLHIGHSQACKSLSDLVSKGDSSFELTQTRQSDWGSHQITGGKVEGMAAAMFEHCYTRTGVLKSQAADAVVI
jgi:hypothetical protein